ncbi:MAG: hypothetical protein JW936_09325 [Sedimentisphaerales bacterium]|nr:hypothetical protein [Sedimentisphaerales bacterium]
MSETEPSHNEAVDMVGQGRRLERLAEVGALTGNLAHELRNPLSTIKVNLKLLAEDVALLARETEQAKADLSDADETEQVELCERLKTYQRQLRKLNTIMKETDRLAETLTDFLKYAGKMELHPVRCNIIELLDDLIDFYEPQALSHNIQIRHAFCKDEIYCRVDGDMIKQALLNIMVNAIYAMGNEGELMIRTATRDDSVRIDIIDTGPGIAAEEQKKIFMPYYTTRSGGTGLGLSICRRIIEEHQGKIELVSEPGKGSNFIITLPCLKE